MKKLRDDWTSKKTLNHKVGKLTRVYENGKIINVEYDDYGNIKRLGNIELKYNLQNKISEYKKDNDVYKYEYNYQGIRTKKTKDDSPIILGEEEVYKIRDCIRHDNEESFSRFQNSLDRDMTKVGYELKTMGERMD